MQHDVNTESSQYANRTPWFVWDINDFNSYVVTTNVALLSCRVLSIVKECDISCEYLQHKNLISNYCDSLVKLLKDTALIIVNEM